MSKSKEGAKIWDEDIISQLYIKKEDKTEARMPKTIKLLKILSCIRLLT